MKKEKEKEEEVTEGRKRKKERRGWVKRYCTKYVLGY
jgi:hypothetical protein